MGIHILTSKVSMQGSLDEAKVGIIGTKKKKMENGKERWKKKFE